MSHSVSINQQKSSILETFMFAWIRFCLPEFNFAYQSVPHFDLSLLLVRTS